MEDLANKLALAIRILRRRAAPPGPDPLEEEIEDQEEIEEDTLALPEDELPEVMEADEPLKRRKFLHSYLSHRAIRGLKGAIQ